MIILVAVAGFGYAFALWSLARVTAARKDMLLGPAPRHWFIAGAACSALCASVLPSSASALLSTGAIGAIICGVVDKRTGYIFNELTLSMLGVALALAAFTGSFTSGIISAVVVGGSLLALHVGTSGRGIGLGDVKLAAVLAISLGLASGAIAIGCAFIFGATYGITLLVRRRAQRGDAIRFGPFIAAGAVFSLVLQLSGVHA